jgi:hypothetical protein
VQSRHPLGVAGQFLEPLPIALKLRRGRIVIEQLVNVVVVATETLVVADATVEIEGRDVMQGEQLLDQRAPRLESADLERLRVLVLVGVDRQCSAKDRFDRHHLRWLVAAAVPGFQQHRSRPDADADSWLDDGLVLESGRRG